MSDSEDEPTSPEPSIPISALEHHAYCPRQAALIHVEGYFDSTIDTVRGDLAHAAVNRGGPDRDRHGQRIWNSLPIWSHTLGLHGICDVVRFDRDGPTPIEHKSGGYRPGGPADLQVAAQVLCLREMFNAEVPGGVVFSGRDRRRHDVLVDEDLQARVAHAARAVRANLTHGRLPPPVNDNRCHRCSLRPGCQPDTPTTARHILFTPRAEASWDD